ncbi:hypothetical protein [Streptomyces sp. F-7]|uniref:hypothetical protein n=1 Tax=Streptomyces sp. F-7 TaxID=573566 RepID=UPI00114745D9|nr:hypothetical protein [Streptomyces sp. F-7]
MASTTALPKTWARTSTEHILRSPLRHLDTAEVSAAAMIESRNREIHLPPVSTYRWWARRTGAVNGALLDAFSRDVEGRLLVADMFAGGGVIPLVAIVRGHQVYAQDLNSWPAAGLTAMLALPSAEELQAAASTLEQWAHTETKVAYGTVLSDGSPGLISHTFRVATAQCTSCGKRARMFPHALVTLLTRKERGNTEAWLACRHGHLFRGDASGVLCCSECQDAVDPKANYTSRRSITCDCGHTDRLADRASTWDWEVVLVERTTTGRRELDKPTEAEIEAANSAHWAPAMSLGAIPEGQETRVLRRHGFTSWDQLYPSRQRVLLERMLERAAKCHKDPDVVRAVSMAVIGSAEMAGHLSRWDRFYLKSYEAMAGHRFNLTTLAVEPNVWGTAGSGRGTVLRRLNQLVKAASWLHARTGQDLVVEGPMRLSDQVTPMNDCDVRVVEGSSETMLLPDGSVHLALTDPPYHDDVQYSELSAPLRAWARLADTDLSGEAVVNAATGQLTDDGAYEDLLARIFSEVRRTLRADGHLIFSYANRSPEAWTSVLAALQRAGLRAVGCEIVHSENETDAAKRNVRACTLDLILDLIPIGDSSVKQHRPNPATQSPEVEFLLLVADTFLKVGCLPEGWRAHFQSTLRSTEFLS